MVTRKSRLRTTLIHHNGLITYSPPTHQVCSKSPLASIMLMGRGDGNSLYKAQNVSIYPSHLHHCPEKQPPASVWILKGKQVLHFAAFFSLNLITPASLFNVFHGSGFQELHKAWEKIALAGLPWRGDTEITRAIGLAVKSH